MRIGTLLNLEYKQPGEQETYKYHCKVIEKNDHYLFIDYPINDKTKKTAFFHKGTNFSVTYVGDDQTIYHFRAEIVAKVKMNVPALAVKLPDNNIKRIQRRNFVRIETSIDVAVHSPDNSFSPFVTVTSDISGGGLSIIIPKGKTLVTDKKIDIWLALRMHSGDYKYISVEAELVFIKTLNNAIQTASLKFVSITRQAQQSIIRYCFEKQREARKKELSY